MSIHGTYDNQNIFARILRGEMPSVKVYEDEHILSFLDVFPQSEGHTLVVPKTAARNFLDFPAEELGVYMSHVQNITKAVEEALKPDGIRIMQFNGSDAGQTVFHLHFHILPMWQGKRLGAHAGGDPAATEVLEPVAEKIRGAL